MLAAAMIAGLVSAPTDRPPFAELLARSPAGLLKVPGVAADVGLTADQQKRLGERLTAVEADAGKPDATPERVAKALADALAAELTGPQADRWRQIELQHAGYGAALVRPDVRAALELTDEQARRLAALAEQYDRDRERLKREARGVTTGKTIPGTDLPAAGRTPVAGTPVQLRREYDLAAKGVLTPAQADRWYELVGRPFPPPAAPERRPR